MDLEKELGTGMIALSDVIITYFNLTTVTKPKGPTKPTGIITHTTIVPLSTKYGVPNS